jgi:hypothetical protein
VVENGNFPQNNFWKIFSLWNSAEKIVRKINGPHFLGKKAEEITCNIRYKKLWQQKPISQMNAYICR